ncbi:MAG: histidine phosphatase family protein [Anaerolineaceae bacterium]|nr:histidine phosphatase family protein [Anaerolineaceae bacterium]
MTDILLIRHSTTKYVNNKLAGRVDAPLNEEGRKKAHELAVALSGQPIRAVYASPLLRTMQTADSLADRLHLVTELDKNLIQVDYGDWEEKSFWELEQDPSWRKFVSRPEGQIPGGEHVQEVVERVSKSLSRIAECHPGDEMVAVVTHGSIIRFAIAHILGMEQGCANRLKIYPGSVSVLRLGGPINVLVSMNRLFFS